QSRGIPLRLQTSTTQLPTSSHSSPKSRRCTPFLVVLVVLALGPVHVLHQRFLRNLVGRHVLPGQQVFGQLQVLPQVVDGRLGRRRKCRSVARRKILRTTG